MVKLKRSILLLGGMLLGAWALGATGGAAELQARTVDGQVVQGEYLGTENNVVRIKTAYGTVSIPSKDIVTLSAISNPATAPAPAPATTAAPGDAAGNAAPTTALPGGALTAVLAKKEVAPEDAKTFKEPKNVNMMSLLASRMPPIPEAIKQNRIELVRLVRNFSDSTDSSRARIIRTLEHYGLMAYPFVEAAYTGSNDLADKVELLQAVAQPRKPFSAGIFAATHADTLAALQRMAGAPPPLPPEILTLRTVTPTRAQLLRSAARNVRAVEQYASTAGGPFNALFLINIYKQRYGGESDPLSKDIASDRARLAATANDFKNKASGWTAEDRVLLIEMCLPLYFKDNDDLKSMAEEMLKKLLPEKHPKWAAEEGDWFEWWGKARAEVLKE